ncbi:MAG: hypothetical protein ACTSPI_10090 [Candidatus Heimdallarchaeaceae archaeon]
MALGVSTYFYFQQKANNNETHDQITCIVIIEYGSLKEYDREEYNITVPEGSTAYDAFSEVAELDVIKYSFGVYIRAVNGYEEQLPNYWAFYYYSMEDGKWIYSELGVSAYYLSEGEMIKLSYTG